MKIWFPTVRAGSGSDVFTSQLAERLRENGIDVVVTWFPHAAELAPYLLKKTPAPGGTDVIHTNSWSGSGFGRKGIPLVVTVHHCVHDPDYAPYRNAFQAVYHSALIRRFERLSFAAASAITAVSRFTAARVASSFPGVEPVVIQNGIDAEFFVPAKEQMPQPGRPFRLLFAGNPTRRKGFDLTLAIMERLDPGRFELNYTLGLRGSQEIERPNIRCLGRLDRLGLLRAYQRCDALLFPSRYEGFGYVAAEAMACSKPVIAADQPFARELIEHGETGLLCPVDDVDAFADAARWLAGNEELARKMGAAGRCRIQERFTLAIMVEKYILLYQDLLSANSAV